jgi:hypothetical protein
MSKKDFTGAKAKVSGGQKLGKHLKRDSGLLNAERSRNSVTDKHTSRPAKKGGKSGGGLSAPAPGHAGAGGRSAS